MALAGLVAGLAATAEAAGPAGTGLEASGAVRQEPDGLHVDLRLTDSGAGAATALHVEAEGFGARVAVDPPGPLAPGDSLDVPLVLALPEPLPEGLHVLLLRLEFDHAGVRMEQRAFLTFGVGEPGPPELSLRVPPASLDHAGRGRLELSSCDGRPHRVRLELATPRGLRVLELPDEAEVPARGVLEVPFLLLRSGAPWGSEQGLVAVARTLEAPVSSVAATGTASVEADPARLPRLRPWLVALALGLLAAALVAEWRRHAGAR